MWLYQITTGKLKDQNGRTVGTGYSGAGPHKNVAADTPLHDLGPLPCGDYSIGPPHDTEAHGPFVLPLTPDPTNVMMGRGGFLIHGDSVLHAGTASKGCLIFPRGVREAVWASGDMRLHVVA